ncbi:hypothetical protein TGDOM2_366690 [Toxoplasma gondii GAB2-2007-GAL-DOM2]|uniref:Uncharacterized protein n=2 Tax=Toxoplasma gondii TaxID=5811 RepID=A0A3R7YV40_TOXGO|nr:hypothetical protein TGDOM2_366690 [Toxoplasma gondii GAB2-2007-GAL-DOM2]RQX73635.1 hypothetical protein TGCAST_366690 [Toxoplasma gondii CAST]
MRHSRRSSAFLGCLQKRNAEKGAKVKTKVGNGDTVSCLKEQWRIAQQRACSRLLANPKVHSSLEQKRKVAGAKCAATVLRFYGKVTKGREKDLRRAKETCVACVSRYVSA